MDNFDIVAKIGEGAYSTVYTVRRKVDGQLYALKKVKMKSLSPKEKQNALNEVRILASVKSPYVISYKEAFIDEIDSTLCIVMEYADEGDLYQKITLYKKRKCHFEEIDIWKIFVQIVKGLHDLHQYNILHRDMKSANVFLFRDGTAKLGDLNVSKVAHRGLGCTQTGTPYYASPEVWKDNPYDLKSDIWSLGCVIYEMIMLRTPFTAKSMEELYRKIMKGQYTKIDKRYSEDLDFIISLLLQVSPTNRPTTDEILALPEVKFRIEEYDILHLSRVFKVKKKTKVNLNTSGNQSMLSNGRSFNTISSENKSLLGIKEEEEEINNDEQGEPSERFVLDTIKMPRKLINLENRLPTSNYESDNKMRQRINLRNLSFPNKIFPSIVTKKKIKLPSLQGLDVVSKSSEIDNKVNTIQMKIMMNRNAINIPSRLEVIVEDRQRPVHRSLNQMKDLKFIYRPYKPNLLSNNKFTKNFSEKSIFGNLNYSYNYGNRSSASSLPTAIQLRMKKKLIPISKVQMRTKIL